MGRSLGVQFPDILRGQQAENANLRSQYAPDRFWADAIPVGTAAKQFLFGQVTLGTLTADLLRGLGVPADALLGQSLGESAGLFGLRVWHDRDEMLTRIQESTLFGPDLGPPYNAARQFWAVPAEEPVDWVSGVLAAPADRVRERASIDGKAFVLIVTTPAECVIGGLRADVEDLAAQFDAPFFPLSGVTLAHCDAGRPVEGPYRALHTLPTDPPDGLTVYSGAWGQKYEPTPDRCANSITAGLVGPIDFPRVVEAAYADGVRAFVEVGPGNSTARMVAATLAGRPHLARAVTAPRQDELSLVMRCLAALAAERVPVDLAVLYGRKSDCAGHRDRPRPVGPTVTIPVGLPGRAARVPAPIRPANGAVPRDQLTPTDRPLEPVPPAPVPRFDPPHLPQVANGKRPSPAPMLSTPGPTSSVPTTTAPAVATAMAAGLVPFVTACADSQVAAGDAHTAFLRTQAGFTNVAAVALQLHTHLAAQQSRGGWIVPEVPVAAATAVTPAKTVWTSPAVRSGDPPAHVPRVFSTEDCFEFARGRIGTVLGPLFDVVDSHPTRVRLPDGPLMLVDHILSVEGEPRSLTRGRVVTDHRVHSERWYLDAGRIPTCVAVEAGQADLFLSAFLGIDFRTKGLAVYRLIDAVVTFHRGLPRVGETIRYDIQIDEFVPQGDAWLFRFRFESTVNGEPLLSMENGVAGFFTAAALASGRGIVHTKLDTQPMPGKRPADWEELVPVSACALGPAEVAALRRGDLAGAFGPAFAAANLRSPMKLPGGMLRLLDRVPTIDPAGGRFGLGFVRAEYDVHPDDWFLTCHFVDDQVMPGTLMYECCLHTLRVLLMRMGWVGEDGRVATEPVPGVSSRLKCRGQVIASTKVVAYEVSVRELGYGPEPFCVADALMYADGKPIVEITNMSLRMTGLSLEALKGIWGPSPPGRTSLGFRPPNPPSTGKTESSRTATATRPRRSASRTACSTPTGRSPACPARRSSSSTASRPSPASRSS